MKINIRLSDGLSLRLIDRVVEKPDNARFWIRHGPSFPIVIKHTLPVPALRFDGYRDSRFTVRRSKFYMSGCPIGFVVMFNVESSSKASRRDKDFMPRSLKTAFVFQPMDNRGIQCACVLENK
jgi:hypothetical protein